MTKLMIFVAVVLFGGTLVLTAEAASARGFGGGGSHGGGMHGIAGGGHIGNLRSGGLQRFSARPAGRHAGVRGRFGRRFGFYGYGAYPYDYGCDTYEPYGCYYY